MNMTPIMTLEEQKDLLKRHGELLKRVNDMRAHQQRYFKTRSSLALDDARKAEKAVDELLRKEIPQYRVEQTKMFV